MAQRPKTPSTPAKRSKNTADPDARAAAPAKTKARRDGSAAEQPKAQSAFSPDTSMEAPVQEQTFESPPELIEQQPAVAKAGAGREERASRALDAIKTLGEMIAEGIGTLAEMRAEMRAMSGRLDQLSASRLDGAHQTEPSDDADDYLTGRDRDPGDAVPPGVAVMSPTPLTETDEAALQSLEELPKRSGRGKRAPRAKA
jgi:uncharacterized coiled-coil protein SlyX